MKEGMKMPGFTADASLYKPRRQYNLGVSRSADGQVVVPQKIKCDWGCFWLDGHGCVCYDDPDGRRWYAPYHMG